MPQGAAAITTKGTEIMCEAFNIRQMQAFRAVIKHGSISRAANSLFLTQSAVSKLISALEEDVELNLFKRRSGRLQPTAAALKLYEHSERVFAELFQFDREIQSMREKRRRVFSVGLLPALSSQYAAEVSQAFKERHHDVHLSLVTGNTPLIQDMLISRKLDVGLTSTPISHPAFNAEPVLSSSLVCILPLGHPLADQETIHARDLHQFDFVDYNPDNPYNAQQSKVFDQFGCVPRFSMDATTASMVIHLVAAGFGAGLVHPSSAYWRRNDIHIRPFMPQTPISYYFCHDDNAYTADLVASLHECMNTVSNQGIQAPVQHQPQMSFQSIRHPDVTTPA